MFVCVSRGKPLLKWRNLANRLILLWSGQDKKRVLLLKEALLRPEQLPLQQPDPPSFPGDHQAPVKLYTHIRAHAQCMKSLAHLNCGNYLLKLGRELALFPSAQAGAGGVRANEGRKTCRTSLGGGEVLPCCGGCCLLWLQIYAHALLLRRHYLYNCCKCVNRRTNRRHADDCWSSVLGTATVGAGERRILLLFWSHKIGKKLKLCRADVQSRWKALNEQS